MALSVQQTGDEEEGGSSSLSEINVTPLVDVMLVLLVIFMVTAPLINQAGVDVNLPKASNGSVKEPQSESAVVSVDNQGNVYIDDRKLSEQEFETKFRSVITARNPKAVYLRADEKVPYGRVIRVMDELRAAGVTQLGMMTVPGDSGSK